MTRRSQRDATAIPGVSIRIERIGDSQRLVISVQDLFTKKEIALGPGHEPLLDSLASLINKYPTYPIQVLGHTEMRGSPASCWRCRRRARSRSRRRWRRAASIPGA